MANFFIRRPIVAIVISIIIVLLGLNTLRGLSFEQYPFLAPPTIRVTATYPGASAVAVELSVATPIEQEVNGVEGMIYLKSSNTSDGRMLLDVNFEVGTDQDMANVLTQNRVSAAQARLPQEVIQQGVTVKKQSPSILMAAMRAQFSRIPEANVFPFNIPTISGFGASAGFNFLLQDRSGSLSVDELGELSARFQQAARQRPEIGNIFTSFDPRYPQVKVELDREKARKMGVPVDHAFQALSACLGGTYVNDFNRFGRLFRVYVQADSDFRRTPEDIGDIWVRSETTGDMIPLGTLVTITPQGGTELVNRFNLLRSVEFNGVPGPGFASGAALAALEEVFAETMPPEMGYAFAQLSFQERIAPPAAPTLVAAIVVVFLLLAALYESWRLPWAVLLGSPLVALGAFFGVWIAGFDNNVYVQIGIVMLIGLAAKNAILIVEFAKAKHEEGMGLEEAALESARLRFRPILMTAFAFILGVVPLMKATGAGAGAQNVMGTAVFFGMLVATALGVFLIPGNYTFVESLGRRRRTEVKIEPTTPEAVAEGGH